MQQRGAFRLCRHGEKKMGVAEMASLEGAIRQTVAAEDER